MREKLSPEVETLVLTVYLDFKTSPFNNTVRPLGVRPDQGDRSVPQGQGGSHGVLSGAFYSVCNQAY